VEVQKEHSRYAVVKYLENRSSGLPSRSGVSLDELPDSGRSPPFPRGQMQAWPGQPSLTGHELPLIDSQ
jgi:hypothetical protein